MQRSQTAVISSPSCHRRSGSAELDVFDATRYFSGGMDAGVGFGRTVLPSHRSPITRKSLEVPVMAVHPCQDPPKAAAESHVTEEKKCKQLPISSGSRLATFLSSLFQQTPSSKKKKAKSLKDVGEQSDGERRRRSSISGPSASKICSQAKPDVVWKKQGSERTLISEKGGGFSGIGFGDRKWVLMRRNVNGCMLIRGSEEAEGKIEKKEEKERVEVEDGDESDSSSDLFELKSYDLGDFSCRLPAIYRTTKEKL